jgi:hypothetical protein
MNLATVRDAGQREARAELDQFTAIGGPDALAGEASEPSGFSPAEIAEQYRRWIEEERAKGDRARAERGLSGARQVDATTRAVIGGIPAPSAASSARVGVSRPPQIDLPGPSASTLAEVGSAVIPETALRGRFRELGGIAPGRLLARLLKAAGRWLSPRERRTPPAGFRMAFTLPETPSPTEMTIFETPFRIPRYMDHPEWRPR